MLKIETLQTPEPTVVSFPGILLIKTTVGQRDPFELHIYWFAQKGNHSVLEIGLRQETGSLSSIELVAISKKHIQEIDDLVCLDAGVAALPVFERSLWPAEVFRDPAELQDGPGACPQTDETYDWQQYEKNSRELAKIYYKEELGLDLTIGPSAASLTIGGISTIHEVLALERVRLGLDGERNLRRIDFVEATEAELNTLREYRRRPAGGIPPTSLLRRIPWELKRLLAKTGIRNDE